MTEDKKDYTATEKILKLINEEAAETRTEKGAGYNPYDKSLESETNQAPEKE